MYTNYGEHTTRLKYYIFGETKRGDTKLIVVEVANSSLALPIKSGLDEPAYQLLRSLDKIFVLLFSDSHLHSNTQQQTHQSKLHEKLPTKKMANCYL